MSKKIKPVDFESSNQSKAISAETELTVAEKMEAQTPIINDFNSKVKAELEKVENLEAENLRLTNENIMLKQQLADYINRLEKNEINKDDDQKYKSLQDKDDDQKYKLLQDENDKYLMKISELTFENAKLTAKLQNLKNTQNTPHSEIPSRKYSNVYRNSNGYSSWN